jgi:O-antigen ligase
MYYIWSVTAPHLLAHPLTGWGPGSFQVTYPGWEAERIERSVDADVRAYATAQRHAHNDYVERLSDLGVPGLAAWVALVGWVLLAGGRQTDRMPMAAAAGIAALAAVSLVDFPMQRPVERFTWWTLAVLATRAGADRLESRETGQ